MQYEADEIARQQAVQAVISRLHRATDAEPDYRTVTADLARQLLDRMDAAGSGWSTPVRHEATRVLMQEIVDPAVERHSDAVQERRMLYADLFEKIGASVVSGVQLERMRAELAMASA